MRLSKVRIRNYRLLIDAELEVDPKTTLIVGRNNTAKTSCFECISNVLKGKSFHLTTILCQSVKICTLRVCIGCISVPLRKFGKRRKIPASS